MKPENESITYASTSEFQIGDIVVIHSEEFLSRYRLRWTGKLTKVKYARIIKFSKRKSIVILESRERQQFRFYTKYLIPYESLPEWGHFKA